LKQSGWNSCGFRYFIIIDCTLSLTHAIWPQYMQIIKVQMNCHQIANVTCPA